MTPTANAAAPKKLPIPLRKRDVERFLATYKEAWETRSPETAAGLFTRDARYYTGPFADPIIGREAIHDYWRSATTPQQDIQFSVKNVVRSGFWVAAEWTCTFRDAKDGTRRELAGVMMADFYGRQVRTFREYWLSRAVK